MTVARSGWRVGLNRVPFALTLVVCGALSLLTQSALAVPPGLLDGAGAYDGFDRSGTVGAQPSIASDRPPGVYHDSSRTHPSITPASDAIRDSSTADEEDDDDDSSSTGHATSSSLVIRQTCLLSHEEFHSSSVLASVGHSLRAPPQ